MKVVITDSLSKHLVNPRLVDYKYKKKKTTEKKRKNKKKGRREIEKKEIEGKNKTATRKKRRKRKNNCRDLLSLVHHITFPIVKKHLTLRSRFIARWSFIFI